MRRGRHFLALGLLVLLPGLLQAQGGPPLVTDDPGTPGDGHWEVNVAWTREHRPGATRAEMPLADINYGWGEHVQLKYEGAWRRETEDGAGGRSGVSDSLVGVKWRFRDDAPDGFAASIYPQVGFRTLAASVRRGISSGATTVILPLELQKGFGSFSANADVGYVGDSREADTWFGGVAAGYEHGDWEFMGEIHAERDVGAAGERLLLNGGLRRKLGEHATLLFSLGRELKNRDEARATVSYVGVQLTR